MSIFSTMTLSDWLALIGVALLIGAAFWLINDSRKKGAALGGKMCGGCPHYCQMERNCDGTPKSKSTVSEKEEESSYQA